MRNKQAQEQALALRDGFQFEPTSLISYQSTGKLIVVGDDDALNRCRDLPTDLGFESISSTGNNLRVDGYLGAYVVEVTDLHDNVSTHKGDAILDLHEVVLMAREMLPPGYFHVAPKDWDISSVMEEVGGLQGEFQKPKYFDYDPSICAHGVNGKIACRQCIDACPAEAIQSIGERIEVNPYLCQGGGSCTTVCPSGAIRYLYPNLRDNGKRVRDILSEYLQKGGKNPILMFHSDHFAVDAYLQAYDNLLPVGVEELASVGMDLCLSALAYGAMQVVLHVDEEVPRSSQSNLEQQVGWVQQLLIGLGLDRPCVDLCTHEAALPEVGTPHKIEASVLDMPPAKRNAIYLALDHLVAKLKPQADRVDLPVPAPFGEVVIDAEKCTLCMACIGSCPGRALQDGSNRASPEVFFIESNCLQCGACVQTCPEDAVTLKPRLLFDLESRNRSRELNRDKPFACIACGKPFAPTSVIHKMQEKLKDHHMFGSQRALDRLKMCDDCRVVDVVQDPDAMGGAFNPLKRFQ